MLSTILADEDLASLFAPHLDLPSVCNICIVSKSSYIVTRIAVFDRVKAFVGREVYFMSELKLRSEELRRLVNAVFWTYMYAYPNKISFSVLDKEMKKEEADYERLNRLYDVQRRSLNRLQHIDVVMCKHITTNISAFTQSDG